MPNKVSGDVHGQVIQARHIGHIDLHAAPVALTALAGLPPATTIFFGRAPEVAALQAAWASEAPLMVSCVVAGLAGIGKTELVLHAAHQAIAAGQFPGGVLFVDLQGYDEARAVAPKQALDGFLRALGVDGHSIPPTEDQRSAVFRSLLHSRQPMLIVLDNASSAAQVRPLLPGNPHRVVITSRHTLSGLDEAHHFDVGVLAEAEASELVGDAELAALCGRLPLALRIMRALTTAEPHTDWAVELTDSQHRLELLDDGDSRAVRAAFDLSYRTLTEEQRRLFRMLSLHPTDEFSLEDAATLIDRPLPHTRALLRELVRAHLVETGITTGWFTFHDLVRLYAERCAAEDSEADAAITRLLQHYSAKMHSAHCLMNPLRPNNNEFGSFQQAMSWTGEHWPVLVAVATIAVERGPQELLYPLVSGICAYSDNQRHTDALITLCSAAVESARLFGDRAAEPEMLTRLGNALVYDHQYAEAVPHLEKSVEIKRLIDDERSLAATLNNLGTAYRKMTRLEDARTCYNEALAIREAIGDTYGQGRTLNNLGSILRAMGDTRSAAEYYERSYQLRQAIGDVHGEAQVLNNMGINALVARSPEAALALHLQALRLYRDLDYGFRIAHTLDLIGRAHHQAGATDSASKAWRDSLSEYMRLGARREIAELRERLTELDGRASL